MHQKWWVPLFPTTNRSAVCRTLDSLSAAVYFCQENNIKGNAVYKSQGNAINGAV
jgi:hypothetical protein